MVSRGIGGGRVNFMAVIVVVKLWAGKCAL